MDPQIVEKTLRPSCAPTLMGLLAVISHSVIVDMMANLPCYCVDEFDLAWPESIIFLNPSHSRPKSGSQLLVSVRIIIKRSLSAPKLSSTLSALDIATLTLSWSIPMASYRMLFLLYAMASSDRGKFLAQQAMYVIAFSTSMTLSL